MKIFVGSVVSVNNSKTASVAVEKIVIHPLYKKRLKRIKRYHVHDELGVNRGDKVRFIETKPISKTKRWKILEIVGKKVNKNDSD